MSKRQPMHPLEPSDLDTDAFTRLAVPQPDPVKVATTPKEATPKEVSASTKKGKRSSATGVTPPSRVGKVQIVAWTTEDVRAQLKALAALQKRSVDEILNAAIAAILKKG